MIELNDIRAWHTVILLAAFIGILIWAYSKGRRPAFDEAANLPFADHDLHEQAVAELQQEQQSKEEKLS